MRRKLLGRFAAVALGATLGLAPPAMAFHGGFGGAQFAFRNHRRFHNFVAVGVGGAYWPYYYDDGCWRRVWTSWGWQWANLCGGY